MKHFAPAILLVGDIVALLVFVALGQRDHELVNPENPILGLVATTVEFALPWLLVAWLVGAFNASAENSTNRIAARVHPVILRAFHAWLIAAPLALLLRALVLGRAVIPTIFIVVAMGLGGAFVLGWRIIFVLAGSLLRRRSMQTKSSVA